MNTIGILGGLSAASTQVYYRELVRLTRERLGGLHSPELLIRSLDFAPIAALQAKGDWAAQADILQTEAKALVAGGADLLILASNTLHKVAEELRTGIDLPFIHIAEVAGEAIKAAGLKRPGLLATAFTMEQEFYLGCLRTQGLRPLVPGPEDRAETHRVIYEELCQGMVLEESRRAYEGIAERLRQAGADCLILGCTEVGLLLGADNSPLPVFDTTLLHCAAALDRALG